MRSTVMRTLAGVVVAAATIGVAAEPAQAASGISGIPASTWYFVQPSYCYQIPQDGYTVIYVYSTDGAFLYSTEQDVVASVSGFCANGNNFYAYSADGSSWTYTYLAPGL